MIYDGEQCAVYLSKLQAFKNKKKVFSRIFKLLDMHGSNYIIRLLKTMLNVGPGWNRRLPSEGVMSGNDGFYSRRVVTHIFRRTSKIYVRPLPQKSRRPSSTEKPNRRPTTVLDHMEIRSSGVCHAFLYSVCFVVIVFGVLLPYGRHT